MKNVFCLYHKVMQQCYTNWIVSGYCMGGGWALGNFSHTVPVSNNYLWQYPDTGTVHHLNCAIWQILAQCFLKVWSQRSKCNKLLYTVVSFTHACSIPAYNVSGTQWIICLVYTITISVELLRWVQVHAYIYGIHTLFFVRTCRCRCMPIRKFILCFFCENTIECIT